MASSFPEVDEMKTGRLKIKDMTLIAMSTALIAVCSWTSIPIVVPITLQTFAIFVCSGLMGKQRGLISVALYILLGAAGIPVFSGFKGGVGVLLGATGGYIIGFLFTALIVGAVADKWGRRTLALFLSMVLGMIVCYAFGTAWFIYVYAQDTAGISILNTLGLCVFPFLIPDSVKIILAVIVVKRLRGELYKAPV